MSSQEVKRPQQVNVGSKVISKIISDIILAILYLTLNKGIPYIINII